jgi:hypothetical protein
VERIYRQGSKLLADIKEVPRRFAELIKAGAWKRVSAGHPRGPLLPFLDYTKNGKKFPRVLKAVAFLGADIPAITDLRAIESLYHKNDTGSMFSLDEDRNVVHFACA